jgi:hypothetical protein
MLDLLAWDHGVFFGMHQIVSKPDKKSNSHAADFNVGWNGNGRFSTGGLSAMCITR